MTIKEALIYILKDKFVYSHLRLGTIVKGSISDGFCSVIPFDTEQPDEVTGATTDGNGNPLGATLMQVRIQAGIGNGFFPVPADGSVVIIGEIAPFDYCILMYSGISSIQFLDGSLGGLVEVAALTTKLNNLENLVNNLVTLYNVHTHVLALSAGTGTAAPTISTETTTLTPTVRANIENTNILHGNP